MSTYTKDDEMPYLTQKNDLIQRRWEDLPGNTQRKEVPMRGPVITVDVSKGSCHYQPFLEKGKPMRKPKVLHDTIEGFSDLKETIEKVKEKSSEDIVPVVFEATGVYHRCLQKYLDDNDIPYYIISPLLSSATFSALHV